jgi:oxygen-independent coproporphyrinogen III oxidase
LAGIYLHIPFCKQACHYCDFHFSTNQSLKTELSQSIAKELSVQANYLNGQPIETIYWGGGTPTLLTASEFEIILNGLHAHFDLSNVNEVTIEANPDDLSKTKLELLKQLRFNRLSIGIQSFDDATLAYFNRAHNSAEALSCMEDSRNAGFDNISIDLIYSIPNQSLDHWKQTIQKAISLNPEHISAYCLTLEDKTVFGKQHKKGIIKAVDEETSATNFEILIETLAKSGYEQYEISNFCRPGRESKHNSNYWRQIHYLGVGPSAHSFNGTSRQANCSNNHQYIKSLRTATLPCEVELLTRENKINEYLFTSLRTSWGCSRTFLITNYQFDLAELPAMQSFIAKGLITEKDNTYFLSQKGRMLADYISGELFISD